MPFRLNLPDVQETQINYFYYVSILGQYKCKILGSESLMGPLSSPTPPPPPQKLALELVI